MSQLENRASPGEAGKLVRPLGVGGQDGTQSPHRLGLVQEGQGIRATEGKLGILDETQGQQGPVHMAPAQPNPTQSPPDFLPKEPRCIGDNIKGGGRWIFSLEDPCDVWNELKLI